MTVMYSSTPDREHLTKDAFVGIDGVSFINESGHFCVIGEDVTPEEWDEIFGEEERPALVRPDRRYHFLVQSAFRHRLILLLARYIKLTYQVVAPKPQKPHRRTRLLPRPLYLTHLAPAAPLAPPAA